MQRHNNLTTWVCTLCVVNSHTVADFNPGDILSMRVALKLEHCAGIKVFTRLQSKLDKFKERAGFSMTSIPQRMKNMHTSLPWSYEYMYHNPAAICIISWMEDTNPSLPPTWRSFLQILREPGMGLSDLADQIEQKLEFPAKQQISTEQECELHKPNLIATFTKLLELMESHRNLKQRSLYICLFTIVPS